MAAKLKNKVAIITGGTTGIGFAAAKRFIEEGATVILTGTNPKTLEVARSELNGRAEVIKSVKMHMMDLDPITDLKALVPEGLSHEEEIEWRDLQFSKMPSTRRP